MERTQAIKLKPINVEKMIFAEKEIVRYVQSTSFQEELSSFGKSVVTANANLLCQTKTISIKKSSRIYKLDPQIEDDVLCVGGRLRNAPLSKEAKNPYILPNSHHISILKVHHYHLISGHSGLKHVPSHVRERFWIIGAKATLRRILYRCVSIKKRQALVKRWQT